MLSAELSDAVCCQVLNDLMLRCSLKSVFAMHLVSEAACLFDPRDRLLMTEVVLNLFYKPNSHSNLNLLE